MSTRNWLVIIAMALLASALSLTACYPNPQPVGLTPIPTLASAGAAPTLAPVMEVPGQGLSGVGTVVGTQADAAAGSAVYMKNCTVCHGLQGQGVDAPPLRNNQFIQTASDQVVFTLIAGGRPGTAMPAWLQANGGSLTQIQILDAMAYLHTLQGVPSLPVSTPMPLEPTETPLPPGGPTPEPARPSQPGGPGPAVQLSGNAARGQADFGSTCATCHGPEGTQGVPNPGSDDGTVPELSPIDPTIANADLKVFAANVDLFIEHGSVPSGSNPLIMMPPFGDSKILTDQQIADIIAYVIQLNTGK